MSLSVEIDVFSGRPNPVVELDEKEAAELLERIGPGPRLDEEADVPSPSILGYRGIVIEQDAPGNDRFPKRVRLLDSKVFGRGLANEARDPDVESYLLDPEGPFSRVEIDVDDFLPRVAVLREELLRLEWWRRWDWWDDIFVPPWPAKCPCGPIYEPNWWNVPSRQDYNNCYNYSTNYRTDTFAQPGKAAGAQYTSLSCNSVRPAAIADKLIDSPNADNKCPEEGHLVALVVAPGWDYHWYRKGSNGWWSHKPGGSPVTNLDNAGKLISDPRNANRGPYTDWCTFMVVMHGHIKIK
jgi:hypothetical protein